MSINDRGRLSVFIKNGFTLLEMIIAIVIIGVLAALAISYYSPAKESTLDKEAQDNLKLIRNAERVYKVENGTYYPTPGNPPVNDNGLINNNLGLILSVAANSAWNYEVFSTGCSRATRRDGDGRGWYFTIDDADDIPNVVDTGGSDCP